LFVVFAGETAKTRRKNARNLKIFNLEVMTRSFFNFSKMHKF